MKTAFGTSFFYKIYFQAFLVFKKCSSLWNLRKRTDSQFFRGIALSYLKTFFATWFTGNKVLEKCYNFLLQTRWLMNLITSLIILVHCWPRNTLKPKEDLLLFRVNSFDVTFRNKESWLVLISNHVRIEGIPTPLAPTTQNGQASSNNSSAFADELFECVWPFCGVGD